MTKKIVALCALLSINSFVGANGYPAQQGSQASEHHHGHHGHHGHHHHDHSDKIADEADQRRLKTLEEQDANANYYTNISRAGILAGSVIVLGGFVGKETNTRLALAGAATVALSITGGGVIHVAGQGRAKERKEILDRRAKNSHH